MNRVAVKRISHTPMNSVMVIFVDLGMKLPKPNVLEG